MTVIKAEIMRMPVTTVDAVFAVRITAPVEMPPRLYNLSMQEMLVRITSPDVSKRVIYELLVEKVLTDYNRLIEDSPIMDMFADPSKYKSGSWVDFTFVDKWRGQDLNL